ncbi:hypothetical protein MFFC18_21920 [Mariniblastus fucicola]|uniref:Uncharacterized protein n=1 Tax=Mariniblastus fucicola TaxID=980251 RepID=A0A5B9PCP7_9BACT|nr:hypothetical protein MFFC18_21920 [Mariniblastus fucicola]
MGHRIVGRPVDLLCMHRMYDRNMKVRKICARPMVPPNLAPFAK